MSPRRHHLRRAFTLLEILAVLVIMGLLASAVAVGVHGVVANAKIKTSKSELATISHALEMYSMDHNGSYPPSGEGLEVLTKPGAGGTPPLLKKKTIDPWGHPYQYNTPGRNGDGYEVFSLGSDGKEGGNDDIGTWDLERKADAH